MAASIKYRGRGEDKIDGVSFDKIYESAKIFGSSEWEVSAPTSQKIEGSDNWILVNKDEIIHKDLIVCQRIAEFLCYLAEKMGFEQARVVSIATNSGTHAVAVFKAGNNYVILDNEALVFGGSTLRESLLKYHRLKGHGPQMRGLMCIQ